MELSGYALVFSTVIGVAIGIISAARQNGIVDYIGRIFAVPGQAVPQFLVGIIPVSYTHSDAADERSSVDVGGRRLIKKKKKAVIC